MLQMCQLNAENVVKNMLTQICIRGRVPLYPGYMARTTLPHCCPEALDCPPEQVLFHAAACPLDETKHPAGTPE